MTSYKQELKEITKVLLKQEDDYGEIKKATDDLYDLFLNVSKLEEDDEFSRKHYYLPKGKAIGAVWAGRCVKEFMRTKKFLRGVFLGIKKAQEKFPNRKIHILYAGTGPFATLIVPLTSIFTSEEIECTLLEINLNSIDNLRNVIKTFEIEEYITDIIQCDATEYKTGKDKPIHMVVTETMQRALKKEPQVAITLNLVSQMEEDGILIPQNISIEAGFLDPKRDMERMMGIEGAEIDYCYNLNKIFQLNKEMALVKDNKAKYFEEVEVDIPDDIEKRYKSLSLFTNIQVFEEEQLTYNQCSLNMREKVLDFDWNNNTIKKVSFQYVIDEIPGFICKSLI